MNNIILLKVFVLTNNVNYLATYYKNISANILINVEFSGFPKISYSIYNDIKYKHTKQIFEYASKNDHLEVLNYLISTNLVDPDTRDNYYALK